MSQKHCIMRVMSEEEYVKPVASISKNVRLLTIEFTALLVASAALLALFCMRKKL